MFEAAALGFTPIREILELTVIPGQAWLTVAVLAPLPLVITQSAQMLRDSNGPEEAVRSTRRDGVSGR